MTGLRATSARWAGTVSALTVIGLVLVGSARPTVAQDVEAPARVRALEAAEQFESLRLADPKAFELPNGLFRTTPTGRVPTRVEGEVRFPVVLALFADSPEPHITRDMIQASIFDGPSEHGTVTDAYREMSRGAFEVGGDVLPWVRTSAPLAEVMTCGLVGCGQYYVEALEMIDPDVDFRQYDNDGPDGVADSGDDDGIVDIVTFEYLEIAAFCGGPAIWPHKSSMRNRNDGEPFVTDDIGASGQPIEIDGYLTQGVSDCTGELVQDASVIAHEFGHVLGQPDYYHATEAGGAAGRRWVLGCWSLMAAGGWGCGPHPESQDFFGPTHMMAHTKHELGWIEYRELGEVWNEEIFLDPIQNSGVALRVPVGDAGTEFLIAEYRGQVGFDEQLPAAGMILYKQDTEASRRPDPASDDPYFLTLLEQDANDGLVRNTFEGGNRGEAGDAWGVGGVSGPLHAMSMPRLVLSDGTSTSVTVHEVSTQDGRGRMVISTGATPIIVPPAEPFEVTQVESFVRFVRIAGGQMPYTPTSTPPDGVTLATAGDQLLVQGSIWEAGPFEFAVSVHDADDDFSPEIMISISAPEEWIAVVEELLEDVLQPGGEALSQGERSFLDFLGNGNGTYDIGDLRKWLRENR